MFILFNYFGDMALTIYIHMHMYFLSRSNGYSVFLPLIFSFTGSVATWQNHSMSGTKLSQINNAAHQLNQVDVFKY